MKTRNKMQRDFARELLCLIGYSLNHNLAHSESRSPFDLRLSNMSLESINRKCNCVTY